MAQTTWYVDASGVWPGAGTQASPYQSIQYAITRPTTVSGDTVLVAPGEYLVPLDYSGKELVVQSTMGAASTTIRSSVAPVVTVANGEGPNTVLDGFTLLDGFGVPVGADWAGGGIYLSGASLTVVNCSIRDSFATFGGGIFSTGGADLVLIDSEVKQNEATHGGGVYSKESSLYIERCDIVQNLTDTSSSQASPEGGGVWTDAGSLTIKDSRINGNYGARSQSKGGGLFLKTSGVVLEGCEVCCNALGDGLAYSTQGAGLWSVGLDDLQATDCQFNSNNASNGDGGGIYGSGSFDDCEVRDNYAVYGSGVRGFGLSMSNSTIRENTAWPWTGECVGEGAGVYGGSYTGCTIDLNVAATMGGGAFKATLVDCLVEGNRAADSNGCHSGRGGGGIAECVATNCTIRGNEVTPNNPVFSGVVYYGGGGALDSTLTSCEVLDNLVSATFTDLTYENSAYGGGTLDCDLTDCLVQGNRLEGDFERGSKGGGIYGGTAIGCRIIDNEALIHQTAFTSASGGGAAKATLERCALVGNAADHGGGAWDCSLVHCTLTRNTARQDGGGVAGSVRARYADGVSATLDTCISWDNEPNELGPLTSVVTAKFSDVQGGYPGLGNIDADPRFWSQVSSDVYLMSDSPCIDAGDRFSPPDQDGSTVDMGAYPFDRDHSPPPVNYCVAKEASAGCLPGLSSSGSPTLTGPDDFTIQADDLVNQKLGMAFWGQAPAALPFAGGTLCVSAPQRRTTIVNSGGSSNPLGDCSGSASFFFSQSYLSLQGLVAGDRIYTQWWFRDPAQLDGTGTGLSDAMEFVVQP